MNDSGNSHSDGSSINDDQGRAFPCRTCGANLTFHIGRQKLKCGHCGDEVEIVLSEDSAVVEQDFFAILERQKELRVEGQEPAEEHNEVRCDSCGANVIFEGTLTSTHCPYCGGGIQREKIHRGGFRIPVDGVLPFQVAEKSAKSRLDRWVGSRWFAPNDFKKAARGDHFHGVYLPFWTYDAMTFAKYTGERGEHYYVTTGSGKNQSVEQRTNWLPAAGQFQHFFDDLLVLGAAELPANRIDELAPWNLQDLKPFTPAYLAGHFARTYDVELDKGFEKVKPRIEAELRKMATKRIGGDDQRLHRLDTRYDAVSFKHILLPVWIVAYQYHDKSYRVFINAVTGQATGDRPYSWVKITLAVLAAIAVVAGIVALQK
ncbi:hypothetical protein [Planctomicrobium sp. SH527]|uniref:hypothetical protein n=1 Tax=Planctomicrobium sp. SH527 TaxID=3448123 RepID=UPI003F5C5531